MIVLYWNNHLDEWVCGMFSYHSYKNFWCDNGECLWIIPGTIDPMED